MHPKLAAVTLPFLHEGEDPALHRAMAFYEIELRYLVAGLRAAKSRYAYHAIGSTLAVRADSYAAVRGFPNRQAGEDFHLLDKLAKTGVIAQPPADPVVLSCRASDRVPFGTGPALRRITAVLERGEIPRLMSPKCFSLLGAWICAMDRFALHRSIETFRSEAGCENADRALEASDAFLHLARKNASRDALQRHLHTWFDGLRTIRFLHLLRDGGEGTLPWDEALKGAFFLHRMEKVSPEEALSRLRAEGKSPHLAGVPLNGGS
jgi:hypothetical protein